MAHHREDANKRAVTIFCGWRPQRVIQSGGRVINGLLAGALPAIHVQDLAGQERGQVEIENRIDDVTHFSHAADRMHHAKHGVRLGGRLGDLIMPGETPLARIPARAYSMANDRVAAFRPPLTSEARTDCTLLFALSVSVVVALAR